MQKSFDDQIGKLLTEIPKHIVVAVSGGADSMACVHLTKKWADVNNIKLTALIVNHNLRSDAKQEAETVSNRLNDMGIENVILTNNMVKPETGIQDFARKLRYNLIWDWCKNNNVNHIVVAHHYDDVLETCAIRQEMGSQVFGLAGISAITQNEYGFTIRPLLHNTKDEIITYCNDSNIEYVNDPSNDNEDFARVRLRNKIKADTEFKKSLQDLHKQSVAKRQQIESVVKTTQQKYCIHTGGVVKIDLGLLNETQETLLYTIRQILMWVNGDFSPPRTEKLEQLIGAIKSPDFKGATLNGCNVKVLQNNLWVYPELSKIDLNRFSNNNFDIKPLAKTSQLNEIGFENRIGIPNSVLLSIPALYNGEKLVSFAANMGINGEKPTIIDNKYNLFYPSPFIY